MIQQFVKTIMVPMAYVSGMLQILHVDQLIHVVNLIQLLVNK